MSLNESKKRYEKNRILQNQDESENYELLNVQFYLSFLHRIRVMCCTNTQATQDLSSRFESIGDFEADEHDDGAIRVAKLS